MWQRGNLTSSFVFGSGRKSTDHDSVVSVRVPSRGPYGVLLEDDGHGRAAIIRAWEKLPGGKTGAIERHGGIRSGDVLVGVNEIPTVEMPFSQVLDLLRDENSLKKVLHFSSRAEVSRRRSAVGLTTRALPGHSGEGSERRFASRVRRARVHEPAGGGSAYGEYEIVCSLRVDASKVEHLTVRKWEVWRRYSDFEKLERQVKKSLGWHLEGLVFPPMRLFVIDKLAPGFLEQRRAELDSWWQRVISVDRACDFHMHHCDPALKSFLEAEKYLTAQPPRQSDGTSLKTDEPPRRRQSNFTKGGRPASLKSGLTKRRLAASTSTKTNGDNHTDETTSVQARPPAQSPTLPSASPAAADKQRPPPPPSQATPPASRLPPPDPRRSALLSQISSLKVED